MELGYIVSILGWSDDVSKHAIWEMLRYSTLLLYTLSTYSSLCLCLCLWIWIRSILSRYKM